MAKMRDPHRNAPSSRSPDTARRDAWPQAPSAALGTRNWSAAGVCAVAFHRGLGQNRRGQGEDRRGDKSEAKSIVHRIFPCCFIFCLDLKIKKSTRVTARALFQTLSAMPIWVPDNSSQITLLCSASYGRIRKQAFGSSRQRQIAFEHDALVLFVDTLDLIARIARVAIGFGHQPADLVLPGRRRAKNSWNKIDRLPDREFMRHRMSFRCSIVI